MLAEVGALRKALTEEPIDALVRPPLTGATRITEVDVEIRVDAELRMLGHLPSLVLDQGAAEVVRESSDRGCNSCPDGLGPVSGKWRAVLGAGTTVALEPGKV